MYVPFFCIITSVPAYMVYIPFYTATVNKIYLISGIIHVYMIDINLIVLNRKEMEIGESSWIETSYKESSKKDGKVKNEACVIYFFAFLSSFSVFSISDFALRLESLVGSADVQCKPALYSIHVCINMHSILKRIRYKS